MDKILLIDDNEICLDIAKEALKNKYQIITAKSGKEGLNFLAKGLVPKLILLDILMPEMDGWEVFNLLKGISLLRDVPIAFLTSLDDQTDKIQATRLGASDYITKPIKETDFGARVDALIEKHKTALPPRPR